MHSRLRSEEIFDLNGQQQFTHLTAQLRFPTQNLEETNGAALEEEMNGAALEVLPEETGARREDRENMVNLEFLDTFEVSEQLDQPIPSPNLTDQVHSTEVDRRPVIVFPFVQGVSDKLRKTAAKYGFKSWLTFPGKLADLFTEYRGRAHNSKSRFAVYC